MAAMQQGNTRQPASLIGLKSTASIKQQVKDSQMVYVYALSVLCNHRSAQQLQRSILNDQSIRQCWAGAQAKLNV